MNLACYIWCIAYGWLCLTPVMLGRTIHIVRRGRCADNICMHVSSSYVCVVGGSCGSVVVST